MVLISFTISNQHFCLSCYLLSIQSKYIGSLIFFFEKFFLLAVGNYIVLNTFPQDFSTHLIVLFMSTNLKGVQEL